MSHPSPELIREVSIFERLEQITNLTLGQLTQLRVQSRAQQVNLLFLAFERRYIDTIPAKTLAIELGAANVRVNAICPGSIEGDRMDRVLSIESEATGRKLEDIRAKYMAGVSLRRFVTAKDVSDMAVFLASDASRNVTGQAISVDGNTERMV